MEEISLKDLLEAGCHFGHQVNRSNPKAREFVYLAREGIQIIDLAKTKVGLEKAAEFLKNLAALGGQIIFVGTKRQAKGIVEEEAKRAGIFYVTERWVGGTITNWEVMKKNLEKIEDLERKIKNEEGIYTKRETNLFERSLKKLLTLYGGIRGLPKIPEALFIVDTHKEEGTVKEAQKRNVSVVGIVDTNADPALVDYPIPANDDAVGSIKYLVHYLAEAIIEGKRRGEKTTEEREKTKEVKEKKETGKIKSKVKRKKVSPKKRKNKQ